MRLLVKRDRNVLQVAKGKSELDSGVDEKLSTPRIIVPEQHEFVEERDRDDLFVAGTGDFVDMHYHIKREPKDESKYLMNGLWSGYRSVLVGNGSGLLDSFYRLKGVGMNLDSPEVREFGEGDFEVYGGQPRYSAEFEKMMSDRFNKVLVNEGIKPVMNCKGYWHYIYFPKERILTKACSSGFLWCEFA